MGFAAPASGSESGFATVILSAGASSRFGGRPKALVSVGSESAVVRIARIGREMGARRTVVVVGPHRAEITQAVSGSDVEVIPNPEWAEGRTGSAQVGLRSVGEQSTVLLWPVDHPFVARSTVAQLKAAAERDLLALWLIPEFRGSNGHPILLRGPAIRHVLQLPASAPLRSVLPELGPQVRRVSVEDPGVLENVDSLDAYWCALDAWKARTGGADGP